MESFFLAFFLSFFLLSILFSPAIFSYLALVYIFAMLGLIALDNFFPKIIFIAPIIFFIAFFLEIYWSKISFTINDPYPTGKNLTGANEEDHARIKRLIIVHYVMILYVIIFLSYYAYPAIFGFPTK